MQVTIMLDKRRSCATMLIQFPAYLLESVYLSVVAHCVTLVKQYGGFYEALIILATRSRTYHSGAEHVLGPLSDGQWVTLNIIFCDILHKIIV